MNLYPYQIKALDTLWIALQVKHNVLLEAACSAGKTHIFSKLIQRLLTGSPSFRVLILVDREILVSQSRDKLIKIAPELALDIGIVCASVSNEKVFHKRMTIASRQSLINQIDHFEKVQLCIVDEVHLLAVPEEGQEPKDQFGKIIAKLKEYNPKMRLLSVTASPYRLNTGYIYGDRNSPQCKPYFEDLDYKITTAELTALGYLAPLIGKTCGTDELTKALDDVSLIGGEFNLGRLSSVMEQGIHITSAVEAWKEYASNRKKTLAFCVTIVHAEALAAAFNLAGIPAMAIHSQLDSLESYGRMQALREGKGKVFTSVAKLTTGMDVPDIDCLLMTRATKSTALYKQMLGRGQRIALGKDDCYILDMVGNNHTHGTDLDNLKVKWNTGKGEDGKALAKFCPECEAVLHPAVRVCPECDFEFPRAEMEEADPLNDMIDTVYGALPPVKMKVESIYPEIHKSKTSGKVLLRVRVELEDFLSGNIWLCFPDDGYNDYAVEKGEELWALMTQMEGIPPHSAQEAMARAKELFTPDKALVDRSGRWPDIKELIYEEIPF